MNMYKMHYSDTQKNVAKLMIGNVLKLRYVTV